MTLSTRIAVATATAALAIGGVAPAVAGATSMSHWSKTQCTSYASKYKHASKDKIKGYNKVLKSHGCTNQIK